MNSPSIRLKAIIIVCILAGFALHDLLDWAVLHSKINAFNLYQTTTLGTDEISASTAQPLTVSTNSSSLIREDSRIKKAFETIYAKATWGRYQGKAFSGDGSSPHYTIGYRKFIEEFVRSKNIRSVVDAPCGVWTFTQLINWGPVTSYVGIDIAQYAIKNNRDLINQGLKLKADGNVTVQLYEGSITSFQFPSADLLICKDALQHLSFSAISAFFAQVLPKSNQPCIFKYLLITNDEPEKFVVNKDIVDGGFRYINIDQAPFNVNPAPLVYSFQIPKKTRLIDLTNPVWNCTFANKKT